MPFFVSLSMARSLRWSCPWGWREHLPGNNSLPQSLPLYTWCVHYSLHCIIDYGLSLPWHGWYEVDDEFGSGKMLECVADIVLRCRSQNLWNVSHKPFFHPLMKSQYEPAAHEWGQTRFQDLHLIPQHKGFCDSAALVLPDHTWNSRTLDLTWVILMTVLVILRLNNSVLDAVLFECAQVSHTRIILLVALIDWFLWTYVKDVAFDIMFIIEWAVGAWLAGRLFLSCTWQDVRPSKNSSWFINLPKKIHAKRTIQGNQSHLLRS